LLPQISADGRRSAEIGKSKPRHKTRKSPGNLKGKNSHPAKKKSHAIAAEHRLALEDFLVSAQHQNQRHELDTSRYKRFLDIGEFATYVAAGKCLLS
jgi:hypothetical protein